MLKRLSDLLGGSDAYPAEEPQTANDLEQTRAEPRPDYTVAPEAPPTEYRWSMTGTHMSVSEEDHEVMFAGMEHSDFTRPYAYGTLTLYYRWDAVWTLTYSNMAIKEVEKRIKKYTRDQGWHYAGLLDEEGQPMAKSASVPGIGEINPGLKNWHRDEWGDMQTNDNVDPDHQVNYYGEQDEPDDTPMTSPRACSECGKLCMDYKDWREHVLNEHMNPDRKPPTEPQPVVDLDQVIPADFNTMVMDKTVQRQASQLIHKFGAPSGKPSIPGPMPFIYDIEDDRVYVGHPGERHSDIQGRFTPGGIIEGTYLPDGKVQIRTDTDMPYTVRHMVELWYALHPELPVKGIFLMVGDQKYRLASANIGHKVRNLVATDPAAWAAYKALEPLGNVYAVGGAVRDVILGKPPKDFDLMVQGVTADKIMDTLNQLPGNVDMTGESFGVIRYRDPEGNEAEIALPRTERSTGPGHKDFEVYTDPYVSVGEDLARRDFTGNAMAVNLSTGDLVDPYNGSEDLKRGELKTVSDRAFLEDPLRIMRALAQISRHQLEPTPELEKQMRHYAEGLEELPQERLQMELDKIMTGADPRKAIEVAERTGVLPYVLPEVQKMMGFDQASKYHQHELGEHSLQVLDSVTQQSDDPDLRMAALLHDIGKPKSVWYDDEGYGHYYRNAEGQGQNHEELGAEMAKKRLEALKYPTDRIDRITHLVRHHMFPSFNSQGGARKYINRVGDEYADDLLRLREGDIGGKGAYEAGDVNIMQQYVDRVREAQEPTDRSQLAVNGNDLIQAGLKPGPEMGRILEHLTQAVLEDPSLNNKDALLQMAQQISSNGQFPVTGNNVKTGNILDLIHDELDPDVFNRPADPDPDLKIAHITWVKNFIYATMKDAGWPDPKEYLSLILTGSLTTYQWGENSDFDVSLWVDVQRFPDWVRADLIALFIEKCKDVYVPGTTHDLQVFVVDSTKFTKNDLYKPGLRSAYDIDERHWIVLPERTRSIDVYKTYPQHIAYAHDVVRQMRLLLRFGNDVAVKILYDNIHRKRWLDMRRGYGDYSLSNIVYKMLSHEGLIPEIEAATGMYIA